MFHKMNHPYLKSHYYFTIMLLLLLNVCVAVAAQIRIPEMKLSSPAPQATASFPGQDYHLTMKDRIQCQKMIEHIYWQHTIWPPENPGSKPSLGEIMPDALLKAKVEDYLRKTNALKFRWNYVMSPEHLQAEMKRMAANTKNPDMLKELWAALDNNPQLIAECLVRPLLVDREIRARYAYDHRIHATLKEEAQAEVTTFRAINRMPSMSGTYFKLELMQEEIKTRTEPEPAIHTIRLNENEWKEFMVPFKKIPVGSLSSVQEDENRFYVIGIIEKRKSLIKIAEVEWRKVPFDTWWKEIKPQMSNEIDTAVYAFQLPKITMSDCINDTWTPVYQNPYQRYGYTAVWTGTEMMLWGGSANYTDTGLRYNPSTDTWTSTNVTGAPTKRGDHAAVWSGTEMIIWGGYGCVDSICSSYGCLNDGARYNPNTDTWTSISTTGAPTARYDHTAVWSGSEMIVWGGCANSGCSTMLNGGDRYNPSSDTWLPVSTTNAPQPRYWHTAVWTSNQMIVWGGCSDSYCYYPTNNGGRYNPVSNSWLSINLTDAPMPREEHSAVWTGTEMIIWGGWGCIDTACTEYITFQDGGRYNPSTDLWTDINIANAPTARDSHTAVWIGTEMIIWGGHGCIDDLCSAYNLLNTGARYNPGTDSWLTMSMTGAPNARATHTAVWTGTEMIIWGGRPTGITGGRYTPSSNSWTPTSTAGLGSFSPSIRGGYTTQWTGALMIIWGGSEHASYSNTGARYDLSTDTWTPTSITNAADGRYYHSAVWTGTEMIVWGGFGTDGMLYTGGRYNPIDDSWIATSITNAPSGRYRQTAVWSGTEMIIWGGMPYLYNTGGRYSPSTNIWISTGTANAPLGRRYHTALWAHDKMIIWGGYGCTQPSPCTANYLDTGGSYDPIIDTWTATSIQNAPSPRGYHSGIWIGNRMIIWGGYNGINYSNTGYLYDPHLNSWQPSGLVNAPTARCIHNSVWTGSAMIIWGGTGCTDVSCTTVKGLNTGARYNPYIDEWNETSITNAPFPYTRTAVWTGAEMIVWGGSPRVVPIAPPEQH